MATQTKKTSKGKIAAEIGAGIIAAGAAAAAGYYFYASKHAEKHRKIAATWASNMKNDVIREAKKLKNLDAKGFEKIVDAVASTYREARSVTPGDLKRATNELKANLAMVRSEMARAGRKGVSSTKTVGKRVLAKSSKAIKKTAKKVASKTH